MAACAATVRTSAASKAGGNAADAEGATYSPFILLASSIEANTSSR